MEDEISEHTTNFSWVRFAGKMPENIILCNISWIQEDEGRARIRQKKNWMKKVLNL
jgi:hypothetical protein